MQTRNTSFVWHLNKENSLDLKKVNKKSKLQCYFCFNYIKDKELVSLGLYHHKPKRTVGLGTNFHRIYKEDPLTYDIFSKSQDVNNIILKDLLKYVTKKSIVLDVGCGTGKYAGYISKFVSKIYALDISKQLLKFAKLKNSSKNIEYIFANAAQLPFLDESIDFIISTWGSFSPNETIQEMKRVLKPGGYIARVGTCKIDQLTSLYPKFNEEYIIENNKYFEFVGFVTSYKEIDLIFSNTKEAKEVLSKITGCKESIVKSNSIKHSIVFQVYKKPV